MSGSNQCPAGDWKQAALTSRLDRKDRQAQLGSFEVTGSEEYFCLALCTEYCVLFVWLCVQSTVYFCLALCTEYCVLLSGSVYRVLCTFVWLCVQSTVYFCLALCTEYCVLLSGSNQSLNQMG
jgi:hypothetical protein